MPVLQRITCPGCHSVLVRKPAGRCPQCGVEVGRHVEAARTREERIERVVAVVGTVLMLLVFASTAGRLESFAVDDELPELRRAIND